MAVSLGPEGLSLDNITVPNNSQAGIIQVRRTIVTAVNDSSGTSWTNIMSVDIAPLRNDSDIWIIANPGSVYPGIGGHSGDYYSCRIVKNGSTLTGMNTNFHAEMGRGETYGVRQYPVITWLDSPASTSSLTYTLQFRRSSGSGALRINDTAGTSVMWAMEVAK